MPAFSGSLPEGFAAVPLIPGEAGAMRVCVLVRTKMDPGEGWTVSLGIEPDARIVLGALIDAAGVVHDWLRIAIQDTALLAGTPAAAAGEITNDALDTRWARLCDAVDGGAAGPLWKTGYERTAAPPGAIDPAEGTHTPLTDPDSAQHFTLCTDDSVLRDAGLPPYTSTLHRYLSIAANGTQGPFVPITPNAPANDKTTMAGDLIDEKVALNAHAGRVMVSRLAPWSYEQFIDALSGGVVRPVRNGRRPLELGVEIDPTLADEQSDTSIAGDGWLFQGHHGRWGRIIETLHLKVRLFAEAVTEVHRTVLRTKRPILTLDADKLGVFLPESGPGMPGLWASRAALTTPGHAVGVSVGSGGEARELYVAAGGSISSVYRPMQERDVSGRCSLQLRDVLMDDDLFCVEGTLRTQERVDASVSDVVQVRTPLLDGTVSLWGRVESSSSLGPGEWRFRSLQSATSQAERAALRESLGVQLNECGFELRRVRATVHDLYALMVLGVRTFLVDDQTTLPRAVDELTSLAEAVGREHEGELPLRDRVREVFDRDPRWLEQLGPHRLSSATADPREALDLVPSEVWFDVLALLITMVPGAGPDSLRKGFGDVPTGGLHLVFEPLFEPLEMLLIKSRSLVVIDWRLNREIASVVRRLGATGDV